MYIKKSQLPHEVHEVQHLFMFKTYQNKMDIFLKSNIISKHGWK